MMENLEKQLNNLSEIRKEKLEKEEIPLLRRELEKVKEKTKELCEQGEGSGFFHGAEILDVDVKELTDDDLFLYKDLKEFLRGKMPFEEMFKELSLHRLDIGQHIANKAEESPNFDYLKDSRVANSAWATGRAMDEYGKRFKEEKAQRRKAA